MTVCVAVIAEQNTIYCVSDRMLTVLGMEFDPDTSKVWHAERSIGFLYAGDGAFAVEVISRAIGALEKDPIGQRTVERAVEHYRASYALSIQLHIESSVLAPLGVKMTDVRAAGSFLAPEVRRDALRRIRSYQSPGLDAIVVGIGRGGAELYYANEGETFCANVPGFVAIGGGRDHAYTQLMLGRCAPSMNHADALLMAYAAKRRADTIVGGVGPLTDVIQIGPGRSQFEPWGAGQVLLLERIYQQWERGATEGFQTALGLARQTFPTPPAPTPGTP